MGSGGTSSTSSSHAKTGSPIHPQAFSEAFERKAASAKLPKLSLHGLRHAHATLALRAGVHPKVVSERLGHASVAFTLDTYTDALPDMQETAAALVDALVLDTDDAPGVRVRRS
ncbi:MAG TPA: tyrosine-type recombinase/integrase [Gaiellaceae bacterium]